MNRRYLFAGAVLIAVLISGVVMARSVMLPSEKNETALPAGEGQQEKVKGSPSASVEIIEYSDFQCPACRTAQDVLRTLLTKYPGKVRIVFRHFPLAGHQWSAIAHHAAECANRQGRFWDYQDMLFAKQPEWSLPENPTAKFIGYAKDSGLNLDPFAACLSDQSVQEIVVREKAMGKESQVTSTPTFFVNGVRAVGHIQLAALAEKVLSAASTNSSAQAQ